MECFKWQILGGIILGFGLLTAGSVGVGHVISSAAIITGLLLWRVGR